MGFNLTGNPIQVTYPRLVQISESQYFTDGTGSDINFVNVTASYAIFAETASYVPNAGTASWAFNAVTSSYALTASYIDGFFGTNATQSFTNLSTWVFDHNINNDLVLIELYDTALTKMIPNQVVLTTPNQATITWSSPRSGWAVATIGGTRFAGSGSIISGSSVSSSYALSASYALTASYVNLVAGPNITINQVGTAFEISASGAATTASYALTASQALTASYIDVTGSGVLVNWNGPQLQLTASVAPPTPSLQDVTTVGAVSTASISVTGSFTGSFIGYSETTGSLFGTASLAITASYVSGAVVSYPDPFLTTQPVFRIVTLTLAEYSALGSYDPNTFYAVI